MRHVFPKLEVGGNKELSAHCICARRVLDVLAQNTKGPLTDDQKASLLAPLSEVEMSFKAQEPLGISKAVKHVYMLD
jgi:hypothetical protein